MSESIILPNGEAVNALWAESILLRSIGQDPSIEIKGGESPRMFMEHQARIQPVYIVGAIDGVLNPSSSSSVVARTYSMDYAKVCAASSWTFGAWIEVPDGATKVSIMIQRQDGGGGTASIVYGLDGSIDGVNGIITTNTSGGGGFVCGLRDKTDTPPTRYQPYWHTNAMPINAASQYTFPQINQTFSLPPYVRVAVYNNDAAVPFTCDIFVVVS